MMARNTLAVVAALTSLAFAAPAFAEDVNIRSMDEACRTDPTLAGHCHIIPASYAESMTLWEISQEFAAPFGGNPERVMARLIAYNQWSGATRDTVIPAGVAFRAA